MKEGMNNFTDEILNDAIEIFLQVSLSALRKFIKIYNHRLQHIFNNETNKWCFIKLNNFYNQDKTAALNHIKKWIHSYDYIELNQDVITSINNSIITSLLFLMINPSCKSTEIGKIIKITKDGFIVKIYSLERK